MTTVAPHDGHEATSPGKTNQRRAVGSSLNAQSRMHANSARIIANVATAEGNKFVSESATANRRELGANQREGRHVAVHKVEFAEIRDHSRQIRDRLLVHLTIHQHVADEEVAFAQIRDNSRQIRDQLLGQLTIHSHNRRNRARPPSATWGWTKRRLANLPRPRPPVKRLKRAAARLTPRRRPAPLPPNPRPPRPRSE